jgi:hypothetical protein
MLSLFQEEGGEEEIPNELEWRGGNLSQEGHYWGECQEIAEPDVAREHLEVGIPIKDIILIYFCSFYFMDSISVFISCL